VLFFSRMVAYPFPSAATEAVVECSTERVRAFILFPHLKMVPLGDVTSALRIDVSEHPAHQDEQVRFRTTYYFRIVDSCELGEENGHKDYYDKDRRPFKVRQAGKPKIVNDTLYRFRMTGKTSALFAKINFESGVLRADRPFRIKSCP